MVATGVEYALHCLLFLVPSSDRTANVRDLAAVQGISAEYLAKLFTKLARAGVVVATEGARGGCADVPKMNLPDILWRALPASLPARRPEASACRSRSGSMAAS